MKLEKLPLWICAVSSLGSFVCLFVVMQQQQRIHSTISSEAQSTREAVARGMSYAALSEKLQTIAQMFAAELTDGKTISRAAVLEELKNRAQTETTRGN